MNRPNYQVQLSHLRLPPLASAQLKQQYCHLLLEGHHLNTIMSQSIHNSTRISISRTFLLHPSSQLSLLTSGRKVPSNSLASAQPRELKHL